MNKIKNWKQKGWYILQDAKMSIATDIVQVKTTNVKDFPQVIFLIQQ